MDNPSESLQPQAIALLVVLLVAASLVWLLLSNHSAQAAAAVSQVGGGVAQPAASIQATAPVALAPLAAAAETGAVQGSAHLDLNALTQVDNIDESDNVRWSLVRGTPAGSQVYSDSNGVDWTALRTVSSEGSFSVPAGSSWSFNASFGDGVGYKQASGVLAGGQCALATVFRAAALKANLPAQSNPHLYPIPGFTHAETVTIWWGTYDLTIQNPASQPLSLVWKLTPDGVDVSVVE